MTARKIVGVFAHPDDESLLAGGTLARYVAEGADATVLTCTGGSFERPHAHMQQGSTGTPLLLAAQ